MILSNYNYSEINLITFFVFYLIKSGGLPSIFKKLHPKKWRFQVFVEAISEEWRFWNLVQGVMGLKPFLSLFVRSNRQNGLIEGCLIQHQNNRDILLGLIPHVQNLLTHPSLLHFISLLMLVCPYWRQYYQHFVKSCLKFRRN